MDWSGEPAYKQVAAAIRKKLKEEKLQAGAPLPSNTDITKDHGVSITVARLAMRLLKAEGLVVIAPGKGNFVADPEANGGTQQFEQVMRQLGAMQDRIETLTGRLAAVEGRVAALHGQADPPEPTPARRGRQ